MKPQLPFDAHRIERAENAPPVAWQSGSARGWMRTVTEGVLLVFTWSSLLPSAAYAADRWQPQPPTAPAVTLLAEVAAAQSHPPISDATLLQLAGLDAKTLAALDAEPPAAPAAAPPVKFTGGFTPRHVVPANAARAPHLTAAAFHASGFTAGGISAKLMPAGFTAPPPPTAADLVETPDTRITPELRQLAVETLNRSPVAIYQWVRNNIAFVPTYGALQGADRTRQTGAGNALDTASLLVALYRAAGISARYAYGTIELPVARAQRWLGGVPTAQAALDLLAQGGIPSAAVTTNGQITGIRLEHVWVETWVDDVSRGATQRAPNVWLPVDPSFKDLRVTPGRDLSSTTPVDTATLSTQLQTGATLTPDSVRNLNTAALNPALTHWQTNAQAGIDPQASVASVLGQTDIIPEQLPLIVGAFPYKVIAFADRYSALPDTWRWQVRYGLYATDHDRAQRVAIAETKQSLADVAGGSLSLSFVPLTAADVANWQTLAANATRPLPAQPIHLQARLSKTAGATTTLLTSGGDLTFGTTVRGGASIYDPRDRQWHDAPSHDVTAGETHALALAAQGLLPADLNATRERLQAWATRLNGTPGDLSALPADLLTATAQGYLATLHGDVRLLGNAFKIQGAPLPTLARAQTLAVVTRQNGVPQTVAFPGLVLTAERLSHTAVAATAARAQGFQQSLAQRASAYAQGFLERIYADAAHPGPAAGTIRALTRALDQGQTAYLITAANLAAIQPQLQLQQATKELIAQSATAGRQVLAHPTELTLDGWSGSGYALQDATTGAADYEVTARRTGVLQGGDWTAVALPGPNTPDLAKNPINQWLGLVPSTSSLLANYQNLTWAQFPGATTWTQAQWLAAVSPPDALSIARPGQLAASVYTTALTTRLPGATTNHPPQFTSTPLLRAAIGQPFRTLVTATDPDGDSVTISLQSGPAGMGLSAGSLIWASPVAGAHEVVLKASDGKLSAEQRFTLTVGDGLPLDLQVAFSPRFVNAGEPVVITVAASGGRGAITRTLKVDGQPVALDANGQATVKPTQAGGHPVVATAADSNETLTVNTAFGVRDPNDTALPIVDITAPAHESDLTQPTTVTGKVNDARLVEWRLEASLAQQDQWQLLAQGTDNVDGALGKFDPSTIANGWYTLRLTALDSNGREASVSRTVEVWGERKVGMFTVSFRDLSVDAAGIPIQVTRTYDSRRSGERLDFGYGWSVDYQNVQLRKNLVTGLEWEIIQPPQSLELCLRPKSKRAITIVLPDGSVQRYTAKNRTECAFGQAPPVDIQFIPADVRTTATLEAINVVLDIQARGGHLIDPETGAPWNPKEFKLVTRDGFTYFLQEGLGIRRVKDPFGNTLDYGPNGVLHSAGLSVTFERDSQGRITAITDPAGKSIKYTYTAAGDLDVVTDRLLRSSRHQYDRRHLLTKYTDNRQIEVLRNEFDETGRLVKQIDADGKAIDFSQRQPELNKETVVDRRGYKTTYTYDGLGNITAIEDALKQTTTYGYDANGYEISVTNPLQQTTSKTVNSKGDVLSETDPLKQTTNYKVNDYGDIESSTNPSRKTTNYGYAAPGVLSSIANALGHKVSFDNSSSGNVLGWTEVDGRKTTYEYDSKGRQTKIVEPSGLVTEFTLDANGNATAIKTNVGGKTFSTSRVVDAEGNVVSETNPLKLTTQTKYNGLNRPTEIVDPLNRVTVHSYDKQGRRTRTDFPDGSYEVLEFDANGNPGASTDRAGRRTATEYDELNRLWKTRTPDGRLVINGYDAASRLTSVTETAPSGDAVTRHRYDDAGQRTETIDPLLYSTKFEHDPAGNVTKVTAPGNQVTQHEYDDANRRTKTTWANGTSTSYEYDPVGRKTAETDPANRTIRYRYDAGGRLDQVTDQLLQATQYRYDEAGNKTHQIDALKRTTQWEYDAVGRPTKRTLPGGQSESFKYDAVGRLTDHVHFDGKTTSFTYNNSDWVETRSEPDGTKVSYTYKKDGQIESILDARGKTVFDYDTAGRLEKRTEPDGSQLTYAYDAASNRKSVTITVPGDSPRTTGYEYDALRRLIAVTDWNNQTTRCEYDGNGNKTKITRPNGVITNLDYDALNRITDIAHRKGTTVLRKIHYIYNGANQKTQRIDEAAAKPLRTEKFGYDDAGKLTSSTADVFPRYSENWKWDNVGNRTDRTWTTEAQPSPQSTSTVFDSNDRLQSQGGAEPASWEFDTNGRLTKAVKGGVATTYRWDDRDRLLEVVRAPGQLSSRSITYRYDDAGNRVERVVRGQGEQSSRRFLSDANRLYSQVMEERDGNNALIASYVHGDDSADHLVSLYRNFGGKLAAYYPLTDAQGSTLVMTDEQGNAVDHYYYRPSGEVLTVVDGTGVVRTGNEPLIDTPYLHAGEWFDRDAELVYLRSRWMDLASGRFISVDSFAGIESTPISFNKYLYANADPVNNRDPSGRMSVTEMNLVVANALTTVRVAFTYSSTIGGLALRNLGIAVERMVERILVREVGYAGYRAGIKLIGPGGPRVIDFLVQAGHRIAYLEVKYKLPMKAGDPLARLAGQMRTASSAAAAVEGEVILFTWSAPTAQQMAILLAELGEVGGSIRVISGFSNLIQWLRVFLIA